MAHGTLFMAVAQFHATPCTPACWAVVKCDVCEKTKRPLARSVAMETEDSYCGDHCKGYRSGTHPPHFWPGEELYPSPPYWMEDDGGCQAAP